MSPWYVTGFCEGEGTFTYNRSGKKNVALVFAVKLAATDSALLERLKEFFGCGNLYAVKPRVSSAHNTRTKAALYYRVSKVQDLVEKIVPHFDKHPLRGKKARRFALWREAVMLKRNRFSVDHERLSRVLYFLSRLQAARRSKEEG